MSPVLPTTKIYDILWPDNKFSFLFLSYSSLYLVQLCFFLQLANSIHFSRWSSNDPFCVKYPLSYWINQERLCYNNREIPKLQIYFKFTKFKKISCLPPYYDFPIWSTWFLRSPCQGIQRCRRHNKSWYSWPEGDMCHFS